MKFSIAAKLSIGFGVIILLMVVGSTIVFVNLRTMSSSLSQVLDEAIPAVRACDRLQIALNKSVSELRGYILLGEDSEDAGFYKSSRAEAWKDADSALADLSRHAQQWEGAEEQRMFTEIKDEIQRLREVQQRVEDIALSPENIPAIQLYRSGLLPLATTVLDELSSVAETEVAADVVPHRERQLRTVVAAQNAFAIGLAATRGFLNSGSLESRTRANEAWSRYASSVDTLIAQLMTTLPENAARWNQLRQNNEQLLGLVQKCYQLRDSKGWNVAKHLVETDTAPRVIRLRKSLASLAEFAEGEKNERRAELETASHSVFVSLIVVTLAGMVVGGLFALALSRKMVAMVRKLAQRASEITAGNLTGGQLALRSTDELGQLAEGFDVMFGNLKDLIGQVLLATGNINSAASQISSSTKQQASSTKQQATTVQQVTSTMKEIAQTGSQIVEKAREVVTMADEASKQSKLGISAVQSTSQTMESIRQQVEEVAANIVSLSEKTQAVGEIIATVNDIAEQSNLLALNATIEAADAGDEGNRFSVVANEMKNLADQAKTCTVQVRNILGDIQRGINSAVMLTEEAVKRVESGKEQADISKETIRKMSVTTDESVQAFQQIIGATNQQQVGFDQVAQGMQDITQAARQTAAGTAQLEQAVASLSSMSQQLKSAINTYTLQA